MANKPPKKPPSLQDTLTAARVSAKPLGSRTKKPAVTRPKVEPNPASRPPAPRPTGTQKVAAAPKKAATGWEKRVPWDPGKLQAFLAGELTLAQLEGISTEDQYKMAKSGHTFLQNDKLVEAEKVFLGLTALNPKDAYFRLALGAVRQRQGDLQSAFVSYNEAIEINPKLAAAYANRGEISILQGDLLAGAKDLGRALHLDPEQREPSTQRARATLDLLRAQAAAAQRDAKAPKKPAGAPRKGAPRKGPRRKVQGRAPPRGKPGPRGAPRRKPKPRS